MPREPVVTRFAPSPTGQRHLGNARTALFDALLARGDMDGRKLGARLPARRLARFA